VPVLLESISKRWAPGNAHAETDTQILPASFDGEQNTVFPHEGLEYFAAIGRAN
jgi:hypothetical protein